MEALEDRSSSATASGKTPTLAHADFDQPHNCILLNELDPATLQNMPLCAKQPTGDAQSSCYFTADLHARVPPRPPAIPIPLATGKRDSSCTPTLKTGTGDGGRDTENRSPLSEEKRARHKSKPGICRGSQGRNGIDTRQTPLDSGHPAGDSDLEEILNLSSSLHAGDLVGFHFSGLSAACVPSDTGIPSASPPSTSCENVAARTHMRDDSSRLAGREVPSVHPQSVPVSSVFCAPPSTGGDGVGRAGSSTSESCNAVEHLDVFVTTGQADTSTGKLAPVLAAKEAAAEAPAPGFTEIPPVPKEPAATKDMQIHLLRAENHALHVDNQMLHRRLQTEVRTIEATFQGKLLGERAEWQNERYKYEMRQRMLETELERLREQQIQESTQFDAAMKTLKEQCLLMETEQEKKNSKLLQAALEKEKQGFEALLREKTTYYLQAIKEAERSHRNQLEEQKRFHEERLETHKRQITAQGELFSMMKNVESSAACLEDLAKRLATQAAQGNTTLSTKMAERETVLKEIEQRLREQQQQTAKQHSMLVTLTTNLRDEQKATEDKLLKERERIDAERAELVRLRHRLHNVEEEQRKALERLQSALQQEKLDYMRQQNERNIELNEREQRVKLVEERLRSEKESLAQQARSLEEIRARATARLRDIEDEVGEERRRALQDMDAAKSEHLQLLQTRQEIELKQAQLQNQQRVVQEEQRKAEQLLHRLHREGAEVRRLHEEATEARASVESRGRNVDQKEARFAEQLKHLQVVLKLVQKERLELLRHESRLLGASAEGGAGVDSGHSAGNSMLSGFAPARLHLGRLSSDVSTATISLPRPTQLVAKDSPCSLYLGRQNGRTVVTLFPQQGEQLGPISKAALSNVSCGGRSRNIGFCAAYTPLSSMERVPFGTATSAPPLSLPVWLKRSPSVRLMDWSSSTHVAPRLLDACSSSLGSAYISTGCSVPAEMTQSSVSPTALEVHGSLASSGGEIYAVTNCPDRSHRRYLSAVSGDHNKLRRARIPDVLVAQSHIPARRGSTSVSTSVPRGFEALQRGCKSVSEIDDIRSQARTLKESSRQCRDSSRSQDVQLHTKDRFAAPGRWQTVALTGEAASANQFVSKPEALSTGTSPRKTPQVEDNSRSLSHTNPAGGGKTEAPPEVVSSSTSSIMSLKSLPSALCI